jgi:secreted trypsin-like serine protease
MFSFSDICGLENPNSHKIVGGEEAQPNQFPWLVALFANSWFCSASLISEEWVLTAAHCVDGATRYDFHTACFLDIHLEQAIKMFLLGCQGRNNKLAQK